ncbi:phosphatase PAP2 family protein [Nocardia blacklockiae]|uniref:phosphatase PAP2 family protein n=1 Tax=Nocardia blacklockiae TaxID=480036 RepID=UPI00189353C8|nr:phosphatase PAP2 family protein [Nocardia blacklockiae]MBF6176298.1 phosphatase PAP2 family protein [Nocardia blacklockiae]
MNRLLVGDPRRVALPATVALGALVTVLLPLTFPAGGGPTAADRGVGEWISAVLGAHPGVFDALVIPSNAYILLPLLVVGVVLYAGRGDWWSAGFLLLAPELAVAVNTWVLKPLWERPLQDYLAYPSGHTVHFVAVATAFVLLAADGRVRAAQVTVAVVLLAGVAIGMIGLGYHYLTDVLGGTAAAITLVTALFAGWERVRRDRS